MQRLNLRRLYKDPFLALIAVVILVPALLVAWGITHQPSQTTASVTNAATTESSSNSETAGQSSADTEAPKPITQAEQSAPTEETAIQPKAPVSSPASVPVCDQAKKQAAEATRNEQINQENAQHERQKDRIRLISKVYRKYWEEEAARHQNVLNQIDATYQAALAAANC